MPPATSRRAARHGRRERITVTHPPFKAAPATIEPGARCLKEAQCRKKQLAESMPLELWAGRQLLGNRQKQRPFHVKQRSCRKGAV